MAVIDLIILGMLIEKPHSAYELQKDVEYHNFTRWSKISVPSVYKKVIQLQEKGYLQSTVVQGNKLSNKAVYSITESGIDYFNELMQELSLSEPLVLFDFNILIANISKLSYQQGAILLSNLKKHLLSGLDSHKNWKEEFSDIPFNGRAIIEQQISVFKALIEWLQEFENEFHKSNRCGERDGNG